MRKLSPSLIEIKHDFDAESYSYTEKRSSTKQDYALSQIDGMGKKIMETHKLTGDDFICRSKFACDPVLWTEVMADLRYYFADILPEQNIKDSDFPMSRRNIDVKACKLGIVQQAL